MERKSKCCEICFKTFWCVKNNNDQKNEYVRTEWIHDKDKFKQGIMDKEM